MMTMHPGRDVLLAHADGELPDEDHREVVRHLEKCTQCSAAVARLRFDAVSFAGALHALDSAEPVHWAAEHQVEPMQSAGYTEADRDASSDDEAAVLRLRPRRERPAPSRYRWSDGLRWAAGILLVAGATVSAAVVGARILSDSNETTAPGEEPVAVEPGVAAVMVAPVAGEVLVAVTGAGADSRLFVSFADRPDASVAVEGTGAPRFRVAEGRVDVDLNGGSAVVRLTLPQSLRGASVTADSNTVVTVRDGQVLPADAAASGIPLGTGSRME